MNNVSYDGQNVEGIGYLLGTTRVKLGLSRSFVASVVGINDRFLAKVENGFKPLPAKYVNGLSDLLNLDQSFVAGLALTRSAAYRRMKKVIS